MSVFIGPYLSLQCINKSKAHVLEGKYLSTNQWVEQFMVFHRIYNTQVSQDEEITFKRAKGEIVKAEETKTPFMTKHKGGPLSLFVIESFLPHKKRMGSSLEEAMERIEKDNTLLASVILEVKDALVEVGELASLLNKNFEFSSDETKFNVDALFIKINRIRTEIGDCKGSLPPMFQAPTIWGVMGRMGELLASTVHQSDALKHRTTSLDHRLDIAEKALDRLEAEKLSPNANLM